MEKMNKTFRLELRDGNLFVDGYLKTEGEFTNLIKGALNHHVVFQNAQDFSFCVDKEFGKWVVQFPASSSYPVELFYSSLKRRLEKDGPVATLHQDTFWKELQ